MVRPAISTPLGRPLTRPLPEGGPSETPGARVGVRLLTVALPVEHGGWGMLTEPLLVGLLVAPSTPGFGVAMAASFAFLARHPLKIAVADRRKGRRTARTGAAERIALLYVGLGAAGLVVAARSASVWWLPLVLATPLALIQFVHDVRNEGRQLVPELSGGVALASVAAAEGVAGGWDLLAATALWAMMAAKAIGAIVYVRARLRSDRGGTYSWAGPLTVHVLGLVLALALAAMHLAPWLVVAAFASLLARAAHGLSRFHRQVRPQVVGLLELAYGLAFVSCCAIGYALRS